MNSMDEVLGSIRLIDPLWSVVLVAIALALLLAVKFWPVSFGAGMAALGAMAVIAAGGYYGYKYFEEMRRLAERGTLETRATALFQQTVQPDSVFACIDGSAAPSLLEACERNLFAEPQHIAAAVAIVTQRVGFLADALAFAKERDPGYFERVEAIRRPLEGDPYGLVAFVLSVEHGCTADACKRFELLRDPTRVRENMRVRRLEAFLARYSADWKESREKPEISAAPTAARDTKDVPLVTVSEPVMSPAQDEAVQPAATASPTVTISDAPAAASDSLPPPQPVAASAPVVIPPAETKPDEAPEAASTSPAPASTTANPPAASSPPVAAAKNPPPRPAPQAKAKAKAAPVTRRTNEPVAGQPRVVPSDFVRERQEEAPPAPVSEQPGAPISISPPQQNFSVQ